MCKSAVIREKTLQLRIRKLASDGTVVVDFTTPQNMVLRKG